MAEDKKSWPQEAADLAQKLAKENPDAAHHYKSAEKYWRERAKKQK